MWERTTKRSKDETKRVASSSGSRRLTMSASGHMRASMRGAEGPSQLVSTSGYSTTMALSTLRNLLATQMLRRGDGVIATPDSRRKERLFGQHGPGRSKALSTGLKLEKLLGPDYNPIHDTCMKAFVRLCKEAAILNQSE